MNLIMHPSPTNQWGSVSDIRMSLVGCCE